MIAVTQHPLYLGFCWGENVEGKAAGRSVSFCSFRSSLHSQIALLVALLPITVLPPVSLPLVC